MDIVGVAVDAVFCIGATDAGSGKEEQGGRKAETEEEEEGDDEEREEECVEEEKEETTGDDEWRGFEFEVDLEKDGTNGDDEDHEKVEIDGTVEEDKEVEDEDSGEELLYGKEGVELEGKKGEKALFAKYGNVEEEVKDEVEDKGRVRLEVVLCKERGGCHCCCCCCG